MNHRTRTSPRPRSPRTVRLAWALAIAVDALQILFAAGTGGLATFVDKPLDLVAMGVFWSLLGWHWAFLPTFVVELVPFVELAPTWTLAVWLATRGEGGAKRASKGQAKP